MSLRGCLKFKPFLRLDNKHRFTLDSEVNPSEIQVHIDFKGITLSKGITNFIHKIKSNVHYCLNLHYRYLQFNATIFRFECIRPIPFVGSF